MKLATFFISSIRRIFMKPLAISETSVTIKVRSYRTLFVLLLTSAVIYKQRIFHENEIVQYKKQNLQNCKCSNVGQEHFGKLL